MQQHKELATYISDEVLSATLKSTQDSIFKTRLKAIMLRQREHTPQAIAERLLVDDRSVRTWITLYNNGGIEALKPKSSGRPKGNPKWDNAIFTALATELDKGGYWSIPRMQDWIKQHHHKDIPEQTVWYRLDKLKYSYKGARPHPVKGDKDRQATFKKGASLRSWRKD